MPAPDDLQDEVDDSLTQLTLSASWTSRLSLRQARTPRSLQHRQEASQVTARKAAPVPWLGRAQPEVGAGCSYSLSLPQEAHTGADAGCLAAGYGEDSVPGPDARRQAGPVLIEDQVAANRRR